VTRYGSHWRRLVKNFGWANQNIGGQKVVKSDKCMGVFQLLEGKCPGCPAKGYAYDGSMFSFWPEGVLTQL